MGRKKKFVVEIDEKYVDQKKHQMVTYIIGKAYDKKILQRNIKKIVGRWSPKKSLFSNGSKKKKIASNKNSSPPPPPQISNIASLNFTQIIWGVSRSYLYSCKCERTFRLL